jgi:hypothetical protein
MDASTPHCEHEQHGKGCSEASQPPIGDALVREGLLYIPEHCQKEKIPTEKEPAKYNAYMTTEIFADRYPKLITF